MEDTMRTLVVRPVGTGYTLVVGYEVGNRRINDTFTDLTIEQLKALVVRWNNGEDDLTV
jgi:hypothetical protein